MLFIIAFGLMLICWPINFAQIFLSRSMSWRLLARCLAIFCPFLSILTVWLSRD